MEGDKPLPLTQFDRVTVSETLQMAKAIIPFLDTSTKKTFCIFIRFQEMMQTIDFFTKPIHAESLETFNKKNYTMKDILKDIMPYCPKGSEEKFSSMQNMMDMFNVFNMYKDMEQSPDFQNIINIVNSMKDTDGADNFSNMGMDFGKSESNPSHENENKNETKNDNKNEYTNKNKPENNSNNKMNNMFNNMMSDEQKKLFEKYLQDIDNMDFDVNFNPNSE